MKKKKVLWTDAQTGEVYERRGTCSHCGGCCCVQCPYFQFIVLRDLKKGEVITGKDIGEGKEIKSHCLIFDKDIDVNLKGVKCPLRAREEFPSSPLVTPAYCTYYWVNVKTGKRWKKRDYSKGAKK
ncbi:MAG: hypothetical protein ACTSUK_05845 [Promethearchaeota archaeon]